MTNGPFEKKRFLFVSWESLSGDLAWQVKREGHEVKTWIKRESDKDVYEGMLDRVEDWEKAVEWADVVVFDDTGFGEHADRLRKAGKLVVGGSAYTDQLEEDREFGQAEMKRAGLVTLPAENFTNFDEAIRFVKENPGRYVLKPSGQIPSEMKGLLFIGEEEDGKDLLEVMVHNKRAWSKKIQRFALQRYASGVEVAVGAFFSGKNFVQPINVNFEHKRLFPGELGPFTGEMGTACYWSDPNNLFNLTLAKMKDALAQSGYVGYVDVNCIATSKAVYPLEFTCFDEETEMLTKRGWKRYPEVNVGDYALSINSDTRELAWKRISNKAVRDYSGRMIRIGARNKAHTAADVLVTPEHQLLVSNSGNLKFAEAGRIPLHNTKLIRTGKWHCTTDEYVVIPEYRERHQLGRHGKLMEIPRPAKKVKTEIFMEFLGLYLAEGSMGGGGYIVNIAQSPASRRRAEIERILSELPFRHTVQKNGTYQISSVQLCRFLQARGLAGATAAEKFVPAEYKEFSPRFLECLVHGFALGDGNGHGRTGQMTLATTSKRLADDLQEVIIKCGKVANMRAVPQKGTRSIGGYRRTEDIYILGMREKKTDYALDKRVISEQHYQGKIWDVEVEDWHTLLVRREGKPFFSSNCRFGYPTISLQIEGIQTPMGELLYRMAKGEDFQFKTKRGFQVCVVIAVPPFPYDDRKTYSVYKDSSILFKRREADQAIPEGVHLGDVKLDEGDLHLAGDSGYALVITGSGTTMDEARRQAYARVKNVMLQNMYYRTDIGERWNQDGDRLHTWGYIY